MQCLSFEFSAFGERVFVNSGTSEYGATSERIRQRSTSAHNAISIDGKIPQVWSSFRVGHRANILNRKIEKQIIYIFKERIMVSRKEE